MAWEEDASWMGSSMEGSSSVSMGVLAERKRKSPEIEVCIISDASDQGEGRRRRCVRSCGGDERVRSGYRLRAKIRGIERFDPFASSAGEMARKKRRMMEKRQRELEDDAGTPLRACLSEGCGARTPVWKEHLDREGKKTSRREKPEKSKGSSREKSEARDALPPRPPPPSPPPPPPPPPPPVAKQARTIYKEEEARVSPSKVSARKNLGATMKKSAKKRSMLEDMIREINERQRVPGMGKKRKKKKITAAGARDRAPVEEKKPYVKVEVDELVQMRCEVEEGQRMLENLRQKVEEAQQELNYKKSRVEELERKKKLEDERNVAAAAAARGRRERTRPSYFPVHKAFDRRWDDPAFGPGEAEEEQQEESKEKNGNQSDSSSSDGSLQVAVNKHSSSQDADEFRDKLRKELSRPFCPQELREKFKSVRLQKPIIRSRDLRGQRSCQFPNGKEGLSYLDHHPDFAAALKVAVDPKSQLRLLREFFFWLKHACVEGSFRPWNPHNRGLLREKGPISVKDEVIVLD